jgi:hypothetical protein
LSQLVVPSADDQRADRIGRRRRIAMRVGLLVLAVMPATACIFDRSTYQGGGRADKGATAATQSVSSSAPTGTDTNMPPEDASLGLD